LFIDFRIIDTDALQSDGHSLLATTFQRHLENENITVNEPKYVQSRWDPKFKNDFLQNICPDKINYLSTLCECDSPDSLNLVTEEISSLFNDSAKKSFHIKSYTRSKNDKPWFGPDCRRDRKAYHKAKYNYTRNKSISNKNNLKEASKAYKRTINMYINKYKFSQSSKLRHLNHKQPKQYWKFLNSIKPKCNKETPSIQEFFEFFKSKNASDDDHNDDEQNFELPDNFLLNSQEMLNTTITEAEVSLHISKLSYSKSPSPSDGILNEYIKSTEHLLLPIYTSLFNNVLNTGYMPNSWLEGFIIPIYKNKGEQTNPENYRPITILSCLGKLFTSILNSRLNLFLEENDLLNENQAGFRKGYSTTDHIFLLHTLISILKKSKKKLFCAFIDFAMAFDSVWRIGLWQKLLSTSVNGKFFRVIYNMYNNIKSCIFKGEASDFFSCENGLRQGENLSPVIFSIFLNDLETHMITQGCNGVNLEFEPTKWLKLLVALYADDTLIISDNPTDFQNSLNSFYRYCKQWKLNINMSKSKIVIFGARNITDFFFHINNHPLEIVDRYKYLGIIFTSNGSFATTRKHLIDQAKKAMHIMYTKIRNLDLPIDLQLKLFDHTILPILTYGSDIWGFENLNDIEKVHNDFLRKITKTRKSTPLYMLYAELGRFPISIIVKSRMIGFWNRLITGKRNKLSYLLYQFILKHMQDFKWLNSIKNTLITVGRLDIFIAQDTLNHKSLNTLTKRILIDQFKQSWHTDVHKTNKGKAYYSFKTNTDFEHYLTKLPQTLSLNILKFRTSNHRLPVETGRWEGMPYEQRFCYKCTENLLGDEKHYIFKCPFYNTERRLLIDHKYNHMHPDFAIRTLFTSNNIKELVNLGKFIRIILHD
jgi:hypothetical protein